MISSQTMARGPIAQRPMPEGGQARELYRDIMTDLAIIQHQAAKQFNEGNKHEDRLLPAKQDR